MITRVLDKHDNLLQRVSEILPGALIWIIVFSPLWAGKAFPLLMADLLIILAIYWLYRAFLTTIGTTVGLYRYRRDLRKDWLAECYKLAQFDLPQPEDLPTGQFLPKQLLIYPQYRPNYAVLQSTFAGLREQTYPKELMYIVVSFEERGIIKMEDPTEVDQIEARLRAEFPEFAERMMFFRHPDSLPGEVVGAGPNRRWGGVNAVKELEARGEIISDFLVTSPDEDIVFHPQYLAACSYKYLVSEKRKQKFYQTALYTFNNNYWNVPALIRVVVASLTIPVLSSSVTEKHKRETFSCYTLNLEVLRTVDYWDKGYGIDDTVFYWRPFFYFKGDWECEVFYIPLSADAIYDNSYIQNHRAQYKQYLRWGWGVVSFPIGFKGLLKRTDLPLLKRIEKLILLFEVFVFWKVVAYLLTFAIPIILLINPTLNEYVVWYTIPNTLSKIMGVAVLFLVPNTIYKAIIAPPKPQDWSWFRYFGLLLVEAPLNIITIFIYSTLPFVEASTRMMVGQQEAKSVSWSKKVR